MDYDFYNLELGPADSEVCAAVIARTLLHERKPIPRFKAAAVLGLERGDDPELDALVGQLIDKTPQHQLLTGSKATGYYQLTWLTPDTSMREHSDLENLYSWDDLWFHKIHVPLVTNETVIFNARRTLNSPHVEFHMNQGTYNLYNNIALHSAVNTSVDRLHLIFYLYCSATHERYKHFTKKADV